MSIDELEVLRKKARNIILIGILALIVIIVVSIIRNPAISVYVILVSTIMIATISIISTRKFKLAFKKTFVLKPLESIFTDLVYNPENGLDELIIKDTGMMFMGNRYSSNDYISGKYKNINVVQADVNIEEVLGNTQNTTIRLTIFRGRWMIFDFNKYFKANIQVRQKHFGNSKLSNRGENLKYKKVMMEDLAFNNLFRTYAQDEHDVFYILTPSLMEKIKKLSSNINGKLLFCFIDNKLHIAIQNNKDSFEHSVFTKINEEKVIEETARDIKLITNFVDELSLDKDLFRREV